MCFQLPVNVDEVRKRPYLTRAGQYFLYFLIVISHSHGAGGVRNNISGAGEGYLRFYPTLAIPLPEGERAVGIEVVPGRGYEVGGRGACRLIYYMEPRLSVVVVKSVADQHI